MQRRVQNLNRRRFLQVSTGAAASLLWGATACGSAAESAPTSTTTPEITMTQVERPRPALLRIALPGLPTAFDPALFEIIEAYPLGFAVYDGLIRLDHTLTPQPMLAERWEASPDGLSWTFYLRQDVQFHHGSPFTATDVVYTFTRLLNPELGSTLQPMLSFIAQVERVDEYTARFLLHVPNADLPLLLAAPQTRILSHDYSLERLARKPSGTGPFLFKEFRSGERITYVRNLDYWDAVRISVAELHHVLIPSFPDQIDALLRGEIDLLLEVDPNYIETLSRNPDIVVLQAPSGRYQNLAMQVNTPPFDDNRVRQALKACIDRTLLQQQVLQGRGEVGYDHPIAAVSPFFPTMSAQQPDLNKARQLLEEAGYPNGIQVQLITADAFPGMLQFAYTVQAMAKPAGILIDVVEAKIPSEIYFSEYWGVAPFYVSSWDFRPSVYETFAIAYHSQSVWNETGWSSPVLDQILDEAQSESDLEQRKALYQEAAQLLIDEGAVIIPYFQPVLMATRANVHGFIPHPAAWVDLRDVQVA